MSLNDPHANSSLSSIATTVPSSVAQDENQDDDLSDTDLSQFQAEIEQNLSSATPGSRNGTTEPVSDDAMDVDTDEEQVEQANSNKARRRVSTKEYYDPELFGLRRSVSASHPSTLLMLTGIVWKETDLV